LLIAVSVLSRVAYAGDAGVAASDRAQTALKMDTLVVSPTRSNQPIGDTAAAIDVVTAEDLQRKQVTTVADALREVPGVTVDESGSRGGNISVFLRGADPDQVLVMIDGVRVNSTTLGQFDFAGLTPENIERIEVMRGSGGTMYGSEAIGGVIQIFTRKGMGPPRGSIEVSGGNASTDREVGEVSGESGIFSFSGSASHIHTEGFRPENDDYSNTAVSGSLDTKVVEDGTARVSFRLNDSEFGNFFNNNFLAAPDPNARQKDQNDFTHAEWDHAATKQLRYRLGFSYAREDQQFDDPPDAAETTSLHSDLLSETFTGDANATLDWWGDVAQSLVGVEYELQSGNVDSTSTDPTVAPFTTKYDRETKNIAGYTLHQLFFDERRLVLTGGVRVDDNDRFGRAVSPSGGASYQLAATGTRLRANYAQGFKAPTLNQLFFPGFGNPDLEAESSSEVTVGFDQSVLEGRGLASASYFHRKVKDLIVGVPQPDGLLLAENVGDAKTDGVEFAVDAALWDGIRGGGSYTYLNLDASPAGSVRRPRHSGSVHVAGEETGLVQAGDRLTADVRLLLVGDRPDFDPTTFAVVTNEGYKRVDLAVAYSWPLSGYVRRLKIFARIENLFDERYDEVLGFGSRPTNFLAGVGGEL
jgi:vitamin B12 transporter